VLGCTGLTDRRVGQVEALAERLFGPGNSGEWTRSTRRSCRAPGQTAAILAPALDRWRDGPPLGIQTDCDILRAAPR